MQPMCLGHVRPDEWVLMRQRCRCESNYRKQHLKMQDDFDKTLAFEGPISRRCQPLLYRRVLALRSECAYHIIQLIIRQKVGQVFCKETKLSGSYYEEVYEASQDWLLHHFRTLSHFGQHWFADADQNL